MTEPSAVPSVPRWLLPGELAAAVGGGPVRRTRRDWAVDTLAFLWAVLLWAFVIRYLHRLDHLPGWMSTLDAPLGALACLLLWWRRRFPFAVAVLALPAMALANSAFGAGMVILLNLALRVPWQRAVPLLLVYLVAVAPYVLLYSVPYEGGWTAAVFILAYHLVFFSWGTALRARRILLLKLREDVTRERAEHARRLTDTRREEREAIAREMHDVLAHRISLLSVHAGALVYRTKRAGEGAGPELSGAEVAESAQVIRDNAHQALDELRDVLHVLRTDRDATGGTDAAAVTASPQPGLADIKRLVDEARAAGQQVYFRSEYTADGAPGAPRPQVQRTAYRVVQEGLTNARKHAPGARVTVRVSGARGTGLTVEVASPLPVGVTASEIPGAGAGLTGLHERAQLDGGTLDHGSTDGTFTLSARLPWPGGGNE